MPWFTCATCRHKDHATGTPTLPCTNPKPCRGTMTADPPRPPADFGPGHVAERAADRDRTLTSSPPPVAPEVFGDAGRITGMRPPPALDHEALLAAGLICPCGNSDPANCPSRDQHRADYERAMETVVFFAPLAAGRPGKYKLLLLRERTEGEPPPTPAPACESCNALHAGFTARVHDLSTKLTAAGVALDGATERVAELERQLAAALRNGQTDRAAREAAEQATQNAVGDFIHGHATRLGKLSGADGDELAAEVHNVLNNLQANEDGEVFDGRPAPAPPSLARQAQGAAELGAITFPPETAVGALRLYLATVEWHRGRVPNRTTQHARDLLLANLRADLNDLIGTKAAGIELRMVLTDGTRTVARNPDDWHLTRDGVRADVEGVKLLGNIGGQVLRKNDERLALQRIARCATPPGWSDGAHRDPKPDNVPDPAQAHHVGSEAEGIREATGGALDTIGCRLGVFRPDGETDGDYRPRLLRAVTQPVLQPVVAAAAPDMNDSRTWPDGVIPQWCTQADIDAIQVGRQAPGGVVSKAVWLREMDSAGHEIARLKAELDKAKVRPMDEVNRLAAEIRLARLTGDHRKADHALDVLDVVMRRLTEAG